MGIFGNIMNLNKAVSNDISVKIKREIDELKVAFKHVLAARDKKIKEKEEKIEALEKKLKTQTLRENIVVKLFFADKLNLSLLREVEETLDKRIEVNNGCSGDDTIPYDNKFADSKHRSKEETETTASGEEDEDEKNEIIVNDLKNKEDDETAVRSNNIVDHWLETKKADDTDHQTVVSDEMMSLIEVLKSEIMPSGHCSKKEEPDLQCSEIDEPALQCSEMEEPDLQCSGQLNEEKRPKRKRSLNKILRSKSR